METINTNKKNLQDEVLDVTTAEQVYNNFFMCCLKPN